MGWGFCVSKWTLMWRKKYISIRNLCRERLEGPYTSKLLNQTESRSQADEEVEVLWKTVFSGISGKVWRNDSDSRRESRKGWKGEKFGAYGGCDFFLLGMRANTSRRGNRTNKCVEKTRVKCTLPKPGRSQKNYRPFDQETVLALQE